MKIKKKENVKPFTPLTLEITLQTVDEARKFYHVLNHARLGKLMNTSWYIDNLCVTKTGYEEVTDSGFTVCSDDFESIISKHLTDEGYKL
jgi:hypothetical protein